MRFGGGRIDSVNDSEGLKSLFPARTPETRPRVTDDTVTAARVITAVLTIAEQQLLHC
ncbi:hypothetical protein Tfer_1631 [Thermincola ferriacetica]|uniref:Uncharacterized protein n=1 Tax=Thermincola ferriacetica TaxID=281456 RepID=A0A0L6W2B9_9FIRM|nr:hypothetical protein [Thermincola ferriacetica]KNZ69611.1 hypothetical protein Tfer_1631 [Thermincola ferriacetica]